MERVHAMMGHLDLRQAVTLLTCRSQFGDRMNTCPCLLTHTLLPLLFAGVLVASGGHISGSAVCSADWLQPHALRAQHILWLTKRCNRHSGAAKLRCKLGWTQGWSCCMV
jgi:hypothetical protein